jgi:hypothetical protein
MLEHTPSPYLFSTETILLIFLFHLRDKAETIMVPFVDVADRDALRNTLRLLNLPHSMKNVNIPVINKPQLFSVFSTSMNLTSLILKKECRLRVEKYRTQWRNFWPKKLKEALESSN